MSKDHWDPLLRLAKAIKKLPERLSHHAHAQRSWTVDTGRISLPHVHSFLGVWGDRNASLGCRLAEKLQCVQGTNDTIVQCHWAIQLEDIFSKHLLAVAYSNILGYLVPTIVAWTCRDLLELPEAMQRPAIEHRKLFENPFGMECLAVQGDGWRNLRDRRHQWPWKRKTQ